MKTALGIRAQLTAGIVLTTLAGIGLIGILSMKIVETRALYWRINEAEDTVRFIRAAMMVPRANEDPASMLKYVSAALRETGARNFVITDASGKVLIKEGRLQEKEGGDVPYSGSLKVKRIGGGWFKGPGEALYVTAFTGGWQKGGRVEFTVPLGGINDELSGIRRFLIYYALADSFIIIVFGVYFLSRSIVSPIRKLEQAAKRIAGGSFGDRAAVGVDNEIGRLAVSFNTMAERVEAEIKSLERVNKELISTQEELLRSSTLAVVGRLAAGIAHEIGNPLGAVQGYIDILSKGGVTEDEERETLDRLSREVARIDLIVHEFLEVSRPSRKEASPAEVNPLLEETLSTVALHRDFSGIEIRKALKDGVPRVMIDDRKLRQVLMNILINAAHSFAATDGAKVITVETGSFRKAAETRARRRKDDPPDSLPESPEKEYVFIKITDTGSGISEEDAGRIFEPFYTTKETGKGTGLGLFVSRSIIKTYGGEITLDSSPGEGSSFTVALPSVEAL